MSPTQDELALAAYVRAIVAYHGHNQTDLARVLKCSQVNAGRKLNAKRRFSREDLRAIAGAYGVDPANLVVLPRLDGVLSAEAGLLHLISEWASDVPICGSPGESPFTTVAA